MNSLEIVQVDVGALVPYENNPRNNDATVEALKKSIREFGFRVPLVIDSNNVVVCGHARLLAAKALEMDTLPCISAAHLTPEQIKEFRIADNAVSEIADWDRILLDKELGELESMLDLFSASDDGGDGIESVFDDIKQALIEYPLLFDGRDSLNAFKRYMARLKKAYPLLPSAEDRIMVKVKEFLNNAETPLS
jgi:hypothetical protein